MWFVSPLSRPMGTAHHYRFSLGFPAFSSDQLHQILFFHSVVLAHSCCLRIGLRPGAPWMGTTLRLTTIHVLLLYEKVNFRAAATRWLSQTAETQTKLTWVTGWITARWGKQWLGHKWMCRLTVSQILSNASSCLCKHYTSRTERPLVKWLRAWKLVPLRLLFVLLKQTCNMVMAGFHRLKNVCLQESQ